MHGMLLAAGRGERMEPLSSLLAKPALDVLGKPLLASALAQIERAGCAHVVVNLHRHPEQIVRAVRSAGGSKPLFSWEPELLGGRGGVAAARPLLGPGRVLVANADVWSLLDLGPLLAAAADDAVVLGLADHPDAARWSSVVIDREGAVTAFLPPGADQRGAGLVFTGFQVLGAEVAASLPPPPGEMAALWEALRTRGKLFGVRLEGSWREAGDPVAYRDLVVGLLNGATWAHPAAAVARGAAVETSAIGAGCRVGRGARVVGCVVTAGARVGSDCLLQRCVVAGPVDVATGSSYEDVLLLPGRSVPL